MILVTLALNTPILERTQPPVPFTCRTTTRRQRLDPRAKPVAAAYCRDATGEGVGDNKQQDARCIFTCERSASCAVPYRPCERSASCAAPYLTKDRYAYKKRENGEAVYRQHCVPFVSTCIFCSPPQRPSCSVQPTEARSLYVRVTISALSWMRISVLWSVLARGPGAAIAIKSFSSRPGKSIYADKRRG